jgi:hypothetical protein
MAAVADLTEDERYLLAILQDQSGIDQAEFLWTDATSPDFVFRCWDFQYAWYRDESKFQIDQCGRAIGKSLGMQMRSWAFPFTSPGAEMLITAPELIHLDPITRAVEDRIMSVRLSREFLKTGSGGITGFTHRPFLAQFRNGAQIVGRIPQKDGRGVKGQHPLKLEMDEGQDYPEPGWVELGETLKYANPNATWRTHGVSRGVRDRYYKQTQPESGWKVHRITAMHREDWTPEERAAKAELYGSRDHPDYRRNILGLHGDAMSSLFVLTRLMQCVDQIQSSDYNTNVYTHIRINDEKLRDIGLPIEALLEFPGTHKAFARTWVGQDVGMCVDTETEIFTRRGWLTFDQVRVGDETLSIDETDGCSYWTPINELHTFDEPDWDMVAMKGQSFDALVTPRHRWLVKQAETDKMRWRTTMELNFKDRIPLTVPRGDAPMSSSYKDEFVELAAWYFTEGSVQPKGQISITQSLTVNPDEVESIRKCLLSLYGESGKVNLGPERPGGPLWSEVVRVGERTGRLRHDDEMVSFHLSKGIQRELAEVVVGRKRVPTFDFLAALTQEQLELFLDVSRRGDGWIQGGRVHIEQGHEGRIRAYEAACALAGKASSTSYLPREGTNVLDGPSDRWHTAILKSTTVGPVAAAAAKTLTGQAMTITKKRYHGIVWCPTLSRGNWLARRNGSVYFTGNTNHPSEILVFGEEFMQKRKGDAPAIRLRCLSRIHLERISAPDQRLAMEMIWDFYRPQAFAMDRTGLGLPIFSEIINGDNQSFARVLKGYNFSEKVVIGWNELEPDEDTGVGAEIKANVLEYSSDVLRLLVDQERLLLPWDIDLLREFQGQTYTTLKSNTDAYGKKQFNKGKFHALDAARMAVLAYSLEQVDGMKRMVADEPVYDMFLI